MSDLSLDDLTVQNRDERGNLIGGFRYVTDEELRSLLITDETVEAGAIAEAHRYGYGDSDDKMDDWPHRLTKDPDEQEAFRRQVRGILEAVVSELTDQ